MSKIDVSKCEFYCEKYDGCYCFNSSNEVYAVNPNEHNSCEANKDCYYKQLQQLKAENEELKKLKDEILNKKPSEREYCKGCTLPAYSKVIDDIEEIVSKGVKIHDDIIVNKQILQLIKQAKED